MMSRRGFVGVTMALAATDAFALPRRGAVSGYRAEAQALRQFAERTHPRGREAANDRAWRAAWSDLHERAASFNDASYVAAARRALNWFNDGHTNILPFEFVGGTPEQLGAGPFGLSLPLRARVFYDGLWIVAAGAEAADLLGGRVTHIDGVPFERVVARFCEEWPAENPAWGHNWSGLLLSSWGVLSGYADLSGERIEIEAKGLDGARRAAQIRPAPASGLALEELNPPARGRAAWAAAAGRGNYVQPLPESSAIYVSIDDMADAENYPMSALVRDMVTLFADSSFDRLILDLRRNGGGDNYLGENLRREIARSRFNASGRLFVLIGPQTFSAGQNLANRLERETLAIFVGEPTGSAPNLYGDPQFFTGEFTGITAIVSTLLWSDGGPDDERRWIMPDLLVPTTFGSWREGGDRVLEAALSAQATRGEGAFVDRYFERPTQQQSWTPFWMARP